MIHMPQNKPLPTNLYNHHHYVIQEQFLQWSYKGKKSGTTDKYLKNFRIFQKNGYGFILKTLNICGTNVNT